MIADRAENCNTIPHPKTPTVDLDLDRLRRFYQHHRINITFHLIPQFDSLEKNPAFRDMFYHYGIHKNSELDCNVGDHNLDLFRMGYEQGLDDFNVARILVEHRLYHEGADWLLIPE